MIRVSPFAASDFQSVIDLLRKALPCEEITPERFTARVLLDPNFRSEGALIARSDKNEIVGFLYAVRRRTPLEDAPPEPDRGWIVLFGVEPGHRRKGVGAMLFDQGEAYLRSAGCLSVSISPYAPGGASDFLARTLAEALRVRLQQPVIVQNAPGAGSPLRVPVRPGINVPWFSRCSMRGVWYS